MARQPKPYTCRGYEFVVYRANFAGRIEIDLTESAMGITMICRYTTRKVDARHGAAYFRTHERAVGYAIGLIGGLLEAGAIADASVPDLVLLEGGRS